MWKPQRFVGGWGLRPQTPLASGGLAPGYAPLPLPNPGCATASGAFPLKKFLRTPLYAAICLPVCAFPNGPTNKLRLILHTLPLTLSVKQRSCEYQF